MLNVPDQPDNFTRDGMTVKLDLLSHATGEALADRVFVRPVMFGGGFIDDYNAFMRYIVCIREVTAGSERNPHHSEISGRNLMLVCQRAVLLLRRAIIDTEGTCAPRTAERQTGSESSRLHTGDSAHLFERAAEEIDLLTVFSVFGAR